MKEIIIKTKGMVCEGCENRVKNAVGSIEGVEEVTADHTSGVVTVKANDNVSEETIKTKIDDIGFEVVED